MLRNLLQDFLEALGLLTRLPIRFDHAPRGAAAAWAYPIVGVVVGGIGVLVAGLASGLPPSLAAGLVLFAMVFVTGALHEDGLADSADGLWGGWTAERRLEIMRDSRIGAYGVIALILGLGLRWSALAAILVAPNAGFAIICAAVLSRSAMVGVMMTLPNARDDGLSTNTGRPTFAVASVGILVALLIALLSVGFAALLLVAVLIVTTAMCAWIAKEKINGQTGDILGAVQQISEIAVLTVLAALTV